VASYFSSLKGKNQVFIFIDLLPEINSLKTKYSSRTNCLKYREERKEMRKQNGFIMNTYCQPI